MMTNEKLAEAVAKYPRASTEPLAIIEVNECNGDGSLCTRRFEALFNHIAQQDAIIQQQRDVMLMAREIALGIAKRPDLPNPDRDADWKNCQKWSQHDAQEIIAALDAALKGSE